MSVEKFLYHVLKFVFEVSFVQLRQSKSPRAYNYIHSTFATGRI